jgi:hypothetical protein
MQNPAKFREYAEECRRLAQQTTGENKATLLIIADAWTNCAIEAERNQQSRGKIVERPVSNDGSASIASNGEQT